MAPRANWKGGSTEQLRRDIDSGRTGDKVDWPDPAMAPLVIFDSHGVYDADRDLWRTGLSCCLLSPRTSRCVHENPKPSKIFTMPRTPSFHSINEVKKTN
jgi:hypothetical protein